MIEFNDWDRDSNCFEKEYKLPNNIESINVNYDRGRVTVYINDELILDDSSGASDFSIEVE